jgi:hypothetical protein
MVPAGGHRRASFVILRKDEAALSEWCKERSGAAVLRDLLLSAPDDPSP